MFDIGWSEMAVIVVLTLIVIGPKELPRVMRTVAHWVRKAQSLAREFRSGLDEMVREAELEDAKQIIDKGRGFDIGKAVEDAIDPTGSVREEAAELQGAVQDSEPGDTAAEPKSGDAGVQAPADEPRGDQAGEPADDAAPKATIVKHPVRMAPPDSVKPPPEPAAEAEPETGTDDDSQKTA